MQNKFIDIEIILKDRETSKEGRSNGIFNIKQGLSQKELFALYQRARARLGITKFSVEQEQDI